MSSLRPYVKQMQPNVIYIAMMLIHVILMFIIVQLPLVVLFVYGVVMLSFHGKNAPPPLSN